MRQRLFACCLILGLLFFSLPTTASATEQITPVASDNIGTQDYTAWSSTVNSYLVGDQDGIITRVECVDDQVVVETYDSQFQIQTQKFIEMELPLFGGFYSGSEYNFLVYGQDNQEEDDRCEVLRVVKYTKDWKRISYVSVYGANTYGQFQAGSLRMVEVDGGLYIRTSHTMYLTEDELHHQANMTVAVDIKTMTIADKNVEITNITTGYISHSFNQFITVDAQGKLLAVDHGDCYPRSMVLARYDKSGAGTITLGSWDDVTSVDVLELPGELGNNVTNAAIGGLACSDTHDLVTGRTATFEDGEMVDKTKNIYVTSTPVDDFTVEATTYRQITNYATGDGVVVSVPQLVKVARNAFLLMWMENYSVLNYIYLDGTGTPVTDVATMDKVYQSDCQPIVVGDQVVWYVTREDEPQFYTITLDQDTLDYIDTITPAVEWPSVEEAEPEESETDTVNAILNGLLEAGTAEVPEETTPAETTPAETAPAESQPIETTPAEITPAETTPAESQPTETAPAETPTVAYDQMAAERFSDISLSDWYATYVGQAFSQGVMTGTSDTTFEPLGTTTRSAFVQSLYAMAGKPTVEGTSPFYDLTATWYQSAVLWAYRSQITGGTSDTTFGPEEKVTREQIAVFLYAYAGRPAVSGDLSRFPDAGTVDSWARDAILWAVENGIMSGSNENGAVYLNPLSSATRAETAAMMVGYQRYLYG